MNVYSWACDLQGCCGEQFSSVIFNNMDVVDAAVVASTDWFMLMLQLTVYVHVCEPVAIILVNYAVRVCLSGCNITSDDLQGLYN